jgi:Carboxypeptidase regulatory-like domain
MTKLQSKQFPRTLFLILTLVGLFLAHTVALAQTDTGRIVGTVMDQNGGIIPGATVTVKNNRTDEERIAVTTAEGQFSIPALKASDYNVTVTGQNLSATVENVKVPVGQEVNLPVSLQPSGLKATVDITTGAEVILDTGSARARLKE